MLYLQVIFWAITPLKNVKRFQRFQLKLVDHQISFNSFNINYVSNNLRVYAFQYETCITFFTPK